MHEPSLKEIQKEYHGTFQAYIVGLIFSLILTTASFLLVAAELLEGRMLIFTIVSLALAQAIIQILFFLHVGQESKTRWETTTFCFMIAILLFISFGSLWIMYNLNDRMMMDMGGM